MPKADIWSSQHFGGNHAARFARAGKRLVKEALERKAVTVKRAGHV
jgi:hypothetical protein